MSTAEQMAAMISTLMELPERLSRLDARLHALDAKLDELRQREDALLPLGRILGVSNKAAQMRLVRDPELRKMGVQVGRRTLFKRAAVEGYFEARRREGAS